MHIHTLVLEEEEEGERGRRAQLAMFLGAA